jgi:hypothetical protein
MNGFEFMYNLLVIFFLSCVKTSYDIRVQSSYPFQCTKVGDIHDDLRQLSYGSVTVRSYDRYDVNRFRFQSAHLRPHVLEQPQSTQEL